MPYLIIYTKSAILCLKCDRPNIARWGEPLGMNLKISSFFTLMNPNFLIKTKIDGFYYSDTFCWRNRDFKNIKFVENSEKSRLYFINQLIPMYINQNLIEDIRFFGSGFFPDFPDPVFSRNKRVRGLAGGQTLAHFIAHVKV